MKKNNKEAYSIIIALLLVWFLLVITTGVFNLVLKELNDNRWMWGYMKAYAWAESAQELALLQIKENWYWFDEKMVDNESIIDVMKISYDIWSKTQSYDWIIEKLGYNIIPLFYLSNSWSWKTIKMKLNIISWNNSDLVWNIISYNSSISWTWSFNWITDFWIAWFEWNKNINDFLDLHENNYLILFNSSNSGKIKYNLNSTDWFFTKPEINIISSGQVWKYRQNLSTHLDNTKYLNFLKYSIYSN